MFRYLNVVIRMARCTEWWEWLYMVVLIAMVGFSLYFQRLGLPKMLIGVLIVPEMFMAIGAFFILDNVRRRADEPWL